MNTTAVRRSFHALVGKPCPHCGETLSLKRTVFAHGACEERMWADGQTEVYTNGTGGSGGLYFTRNKPWHCMDCGKQIANNMLSVSGERKGTDDRK